MRELRGRAKLTHFKKIEVLVWQCAVRMHAWRPAGDSADSAWKMEVLWVVLAAEHCS